MKILKLDGNYIEYSINDKSAAAIILLEGLPAKPSRIKLISELTNLGYSVFYPRYRGTWESTGKFLQKSPSLEIDSLITRIKNGVEKKEFEQIDIIASSFGGAVALSLKNTSLLNKIILLSPVINFKKINQIETLENFLKEKFPEGYRFNHPSWQNLLDNKIMWPEKYFDGRRYSEKYIIFAGKLDPQINFRDLEKFAKTQKIKIITVSKKGHISYSKLDTTLMKMIASFLMS